MCGSVVDIQSATAENRRGKKKKRKKGRKKERKKKKKKKKKKETRAAKYNVRICYAGRP